MSNEENPVMTFPCEFPIKAMGLAIDDLHLKIFQLVQQHVPDLEHESVTQRPSKNGKYLSVTITIEASSRAQLDAIYMDLTACEHVIMAL